MNSNSLQPQPTACPMRCVAAILHCWYFTAAYGALAGAVYGIILAAKLGCPIEDGLVVGGSLIGAIFGAIYGSITGIVGAALGGPIGCAIGGLLGGLVLIPCFLPDYCDGTALISFSIIPALIAATFGATVGFSARLGIPVLPGMRGLIHVVYSSPLGHWLGWRR
jgi:hypothetical protein